MTDHQQVREALELAFEETDSCIVANKCQKALAALSRLEAAADHVPDAGKMVPELSRDDVVRQFDESVKVIRDIMEFIRLHAENPRGFDPELAERRVNERLDKIASLVRSVPVGEVKPAPPGSGGWQSYAEALERERDFFRRLAQSKSKHERGDVWYWQGDGDDHPESMGNDMVVVIRADQLRALTTPPAPPEGWRPIETAPKDGTHLILWWDGAAREGWCGGAGKSRDGGDWWCSHSLTVCSGRPTLWQPMPAAPQPGDKP